MLAGCSSHPIPACPLVKDDVACDMHTLCRQIEDTVCLATSLVPEEHHGLALVHGLLEMWVHILDVCDPTKSVRQNTCTACVHAKPRMASFETNNTCMSFSG